MGESRRKKERKRDSIKPTSKLTPFPPPADAVVANKQTEFCANVVAKILDDDSSLSFSKPVDELWDVSILGDYFEKIKQPMDLGTVRKNLQNAVYVYPDSNLFDANAFREQLRLVFLNSIDYNAKGTELYRLATRFLLFADSELAELPGQPTLPEDPKNNVASEKPGKVDKPDRPENADKPDKATKSEKSERAKPTATNEDTSAVRSDEANDEPMEDPDHEDDLSEMDEHEKLSRQISTMVKHRARREAALAELELSRNVPLTYEENSKLRDEVEALPWDKAQKVVQILRKYVDAALSEASETDPEFVTLEFSTVEPRLLRDIEELIRPDPRVEKEKKAIASLSDDIQDLQRKLRKLPDREHSSRKKQRRRR